MDFIAFQMENQQIQKICSTTRKRQITAIDDARNLCIDWKSTSIWEAENWFLNCVRWFEPINRWRASYWMAQSAIICFEMVSLPTQRFRRSFNPKSRSDGCERCWDWIIIWLAVRYKLYSKAHDFAVNYEKPRRVKHFFHTYLARSPPPLQWSARIEIGVVLSLGPYSCVKQFIIEISKSHKRHSVRMKYNCNIGCQLVRK